MSFKAVKTLKQDRITKNQSNNLTTLLFFLLLKRIQKANKEERDKLKDIFSKDVRSEKELDYTLSLIKKYNVIKGCYQKAEHYINLASNSLSLFNDCEEKSILENLTSFSLARNF